MEKWNTLHFLFCLFAENKEIGMELTGKMLLLTFSCEKLCFGNQNKSIIYNTSLIFHLVRWKWVSYITLFSTKELVKCLIFSIFTLYHKYEKMEKTALDRYEEIVTDALSYCTAKLRKSFIVKSKWIANKSFKSIIFAAWNSNYRHQRWKFYANFNGI